MHWLKNLKKRVCPESKPKPRKKEEYIQSVKVGADIIEKGLRKVKKTSIIKLLKSEPGKMSLSSYDEICAKIGNGKITIDD